MGITCSKSQLVYPLSVKRPVQKSELDILENKIKLYSSLKRIDSYEKRRRLSLQEYKSL